LWTQSDAQGIRRVTILLCSTSPCESRPAWVYSGGSGVSSSMIMAKRVSTCLLSKSSAASSRAFKPALDSQTNYSQPYTLYVQMSRFRDPYFSISRSACSNVALKEASWVFVTLALCASCMPGITNQPLKSTVTIRLRWRCAERSKYCQCV